MAAGRPSYADPNVFLHDGLRARVSTGLLLIGDDEEARRYAQLVAKPDFGLFQAPTASGLLVHLNLEAVARLNPGDTGVCDSARLLRTVLHLENVEQYLDSEGGRFVLQDVCEGIAEANLPGVIASTSPDGYQRVLDDICRLVGLIPFYRLSRSGAPGEGGEIAFLMMEAGDRSDTGWLVMVRYHLTAPIVDPVRPIPDEQADQALRMVDVIEVVGTREQPEGVMIGFHPEALGVGQQQRAFSAAEVVARKVVGRKLGTDESVEARRAIVFT